MGHPYLFGEGRKDGRRRVGADPADEPRFRMRSLNEFGKTADWLRTHSDWPTIESGCRTDYWRDALAAEALLYRPEYRQQNPPFTGFITEDARPGGASMSAYAEMKRFPAAAALFPLASDGTNPPAIARIWAVGADATGCMPPAAATPFALEGAEEIREVADHRQIRLYADLPAHVEITGRSWHLAAYLAIDALLADDLDYTIRLASEWILTGEVVGERIKPVVITNKTLCALSSRRRWIIPHGNENNFRDAQKVYNTEHPYTTVRTLDEAFESVRNHRFIQRPDERWPRTSEALHALLGQSVQPILEILAHTRTRDLYLWPIIGLGDIEARKRAIMERFPNIRILVMPALPGADLEQAERTLQRHFALHAEHRAILFSNAGGSWPVQHVFASQARSCNAPIIAQASEAGAFVKVWRNRFATLFCKLNICFALAILPASLGLGCRPAREPSLPDGAALADLLAKSDLRLTGYVMASEGGYGSEYVGGIFTRSTPDRKDYYLIGMPVGGKPDVAYLGDRITVNKFYMDYGYLLVDYQTQSGSNIISGVMLNNIQGTYLGTDGRYPADEPVPAVAPLRVPDDNKYSRGGFTREQVATIDAFMSNLKRWVKSDDGVSIGKLIRYQLDVSLDGEIDYTVKDQAEFKRLYRRIFYPQFKQQIAATRADDIFCNWKGVCFGQGEVWLAPGEGRDVKIAALWNEKPPK
jgi:hypothetical protein